MSISTIRNKPKMWASAALVAAGLAGGAVLGTTLSAGAATTTPSVSTATSNAADSTSTSAAAADPAALFPAHGSASHEGAETAVTGDAATKAQAAAVKSVGSGTAGAVVSDFNKNGYEVTVTKADGSTTDVHLDSSFNVARGGHGGHGDGDNDGPGAGTGSGSSASA